LKSVRLIFRTVGWGGNEIAASRVAAAMCDAGVDCSAEFSDPGQRLRFLEIAPGVAFGSSNPSFTLVIESSLLRAAWTTPVSELLSNTRWIYAPFLGHEWNVGLLRVLKWVAATLFFMVVKGRVVAPYWNFLPSFLRRWTVCFPNTPAIASSTSIRRAGKRLVCVARIDFFHKQQDLLLRLVAREKAQGRLADYELVFVGDGNDGDRLRAMTAPFQWARVVGWSTPEEHFSSEAIAILSSRFEGLPLAALEALSLGVPVVATPDCNLTDLLADACMYSFRSSASLVDAVEYVEKNRGVVVERAQKLIRSRYSRHVLQEEICKWITRQ
jgi:glycosyltransferase involved in cell wall biosynthesis